jgi:hypothetical protein
MVSPIRCRSTRNPQGPPLHKTVLCCESHAVTSKRDSAAADAAYCWAIVSLREKPILKRRCHFWRQLLRRGAHLWEPFGGGDSAESTTKEIGIPFSYGCRTDQARQLSQSRDVRLTQIGRDWNVSSATANLNPRGKLKELECCSCRITRKHADNVWDSSERSWIHAFLMTKRTPKRIPRLVCTTFAFREGLKLTKQPRCIDCGAVSVG